MLVFWRLALSWNDSFSPNNATEYKPEFCVYAIYDKMLHKNSQYLSTYNGVALTPYSALWFSYEKYVQSHQTDVANKYWRHPLLSYMIQTGIHRAFYLDSFDSVARFCLFSSIWFWFVSVWCTLCGWTLILFFCIFATDSFTRWFVRPFH